MINFERMLLCISKISAMPLKLDTKVAQTKYIKKCNSNTQDQVIIPTNISTLRNALWQKKM